VPNKDKPFLVLAYDVLGERQAGPAIRTLALAEELATVGPVTILGDGKPPDFGSDNITFVERSDAQPLADFLAGFKAALVPPLVALTFPEILETSIPLAIDLFDPVVWENLELHRSKPLPERRFQHERHLAALLAGIIRGDYFLVASYRQLDLFMGALMVANRINPDTWRHRHGTEQIIGLVPFGLPNILPPSADEVSLPEGIPDDVPLVVWGGGMWDWLEPEIVVSAWPEVLKRYPRAVLAFPGTHHPNPHVPVMGAVSRARRIATDLGIMDSIVFGQWLPRNEYLGLLSQASCGVSAHSPGLECRYAARTRYLDAIWMGLPMVVSEGDEYAEYIADHKLGIVVRESNPQDFAQGMLRVLDSGRSSYTENFLRVRSRLAWRRMAAPLVEWAKNPRVTHGPGSEFFRAATGRASPRGRPSDPMSLLRRILSKVSRS
jgi:glycosyltransferase involved in cell wall biosynthesis